MRNSAIATLCALSLLTACQTKTQTGALVGTGLGVGVGYAVGGGTGALIGGAAGAVTGALVGHALDEADRRNLENRSPRTLDRIDNQEQLTDQDIIEMTRAGIKPDVIISQIEYTNSVFYLSTADIIRLKEAGVDQSVIDAMIKTRP